MKYIMALLAIFLIACGGGSSEAATSEDIEGKPYLGMSAFAIMHPRFPCDKLIEFTSKIDSHPAISVLWGTFGDSTQCLSRWLQSQSYRPHLVQIHFSNEVCRRKSNCAEGEFFGDLSVRQYDALVVGDSPAFKQGVASRMDEILTTINKWKNPFTKVVIGMGLEDQYSHLAALKLYDEIDRHTDYEISRNPLSYNASAIAPIHELHGVRPPLQSPCIANLDGVSISGGGDSYQPSISVDEFGGYVQNYCHCEAIFGWSAELQGIKGGSFVAPLDRYFSWPRHFNESLAGLLVC